MVYPQARWLALALLIQAGCDADVIVVLPPVADAGFDRVVLVGDTVNLDASRSRDSSGTMDGLTFDWILVTAPVGSSVTLANAASSQPTFVADLPGTFIFQLIVREGGLASAPDYVNVMARTAMELDWIVPADGDTDVLVGTSVVVAFSAAVQASSVHAGTIGIADPATGPVQTSVSLEPGNRVVVLRPVVPLVPGTTYRLTVSQGVTDLFGSTLAEPSISWFSTTSAASDDVPPRVIATEPETGDTVGAGVVVRAVFSEPVAPATVTGASVMLMDSAGAMVSSTVTLSADVVATLVADAPLAAGETYTVTLADSLTDLAGNPLDGDSNGTAGGNFRFSFSVTTATDTEPPVVTSVVPGDGFTEVGLGTSVVVSFSEAIDPATITGATLTLAPARDLANPVAARVTVDLSRLFATLQPDNWLDPAETLVVTLADTTTDLAGNALDGDGDGTAGGAFVSRFTTGNPIGTTGILTVALSIYPGDPLLIELADPDLNVTAGSDSAVVSVTTEHGEVETVTLYETGPASGIFTASVATEFLPAVPGSNGDGTVTIQAGDTVTVSYDDQLPSSGEDPLVTAEVTVMGGADGTVSVVNAGNNQMEVTVIDNDPVANPSMGTDILGCRESPCVRLSTPSTGDGEDLSLLVESIEGTFSIMVPTTVSAVAIPGNGVLEIAGAATIEVTYMDGLRANGDNRGFTVVGSTNIALDHVLIRDQPGGAGNVVATLTISTDDDVALYAAGYDDQDGYLGDQSVNWTVNGGIGDVDPPQGMSTVFQASTVGFGTVRATHPDDTVSHHDTGLITVVAGGLDYVLIRDASGGGGNEVGDITLPTNETRTFYAAGYDADDNFVGNTVVNWAVSGAIGTVSPSIGSSTLFDPTTVGSGSVAATHSSGTVTGDTTGTITVNWGPLAYIVIYSETGGPDGTGAPVGDLALTTDGSETLYAAGFDADGNYLGDEPVAWSVTGGLGIVNTNTVSSTTFDPTTVGSGQIVATHGTAGSDSTGTVTVTVGGLARIEIRDAAGGGGSLVGPGTITTDDSIVVFAAGYDADDNFLGDQSVTWSVTGGIGTIAAGPSTNAVFAATTPSPGPGNVIRATADVAGTPTDFDSGEFIVNVGATHSVRIMDTAGCGGSEVGDLSLTTDNDSTVFYAVGFDADDNCVGNETDVAWAVNGGIGNLSASSGSNQTTLEATVDGSGSITLTHDGLAVSDDTGTISVGVGEMAKILIRDALGGAGNEVGDLSITVDDTVNLYAAGYDNDNNWVSDPTVTWSVIGGIGGVLPVNSNSTVFSPTGSGTGTIEATHAAGTDSTGTITVTSSIANLDYVRIMDAAGCTGTLANGTEIDALPVTTDDTVTLYAVGFNSANECIQDVPVTWVLNNSASGVFLDSSPAASMRFDPTNANTTTTITADHANALVTDDTTGTITITVGALVSITVEDAPGGVGAAVGNLTLATDDPRTWYAAGYDADANYIADQSVTWSVTGGAIGTVTPTSGSSTQFNPTTAGSGQVRANHASALVTEDTTGTITVTAGSLSYIRIDDAAGGTGSAIGVVGLTADQTLPVYAVGYDADDNFVADVDVTWSVTGGIGAIPGGPTTNAVFDATTVGTGNIQAMHTSADPDTTGTITVTAGALNAVVVRTEADGNGTEVGDITMTTDDTVIVYAAGYDADGNFTGNETVDWSLSDAIGTLSVANGTSTELDATTIGAGSILADHPGAGITDDSTGVITVNGGALVEVRIRDAASGGGSEVGDRTWTTNDQPTLYAAGYDGDGNYIGDQSVTWSVTNSLGDFAPNPAPSTIFYASTVGTGVITADHATAADDDTGTITVQTGVLEYVIIRDAAGGGGSEVGAVSLTTDDSRTWYAAAYDSDDNYISDVSVTWVVSGGIGTVSPVTGASTTFDPTLVGQGTVTANHPDADVTDDSTGTIDVAIGGLDYVLVRDAASGAGNEVGDITLAIDATQVFWAAGYDGDGNYRNDESVTWTLTSQGGTGTVSPVSGTSTTLTPTGEGNVTLTADHGSATDDTTGTIEIVGSAAPEVTAVTPSSSLRNDLGVTLTIDGDNFDCGPDPTVEFSPAGNIVVTSVDSCSTIQLTITADVPCGAALTSYDVIVTNDDGESGIGSNLFDVYADTEGGYGDPSCSDSHDNDCDSLEDGADPDCDPPGEIQVSCSTPETSPGPSRCIVALDGVAGQAGYLSCTAEPKVTQLFYDPFDDFSQWPTLVSGTTQIDCSSLPTGCAAMARNASWEVERTVDTSGMDRVCLDFRIAQTNAGWGEYIAIELNTGTGGWQLAFEWDANNYYDNNTWHDDASTARADWFGPVCLTDVNPAAGDNPSLGLRLYAASSRPGDIVFIDEMIATGAPGTQSNLFCEPFDNLDDWTTYDDWGDLETAYVLGDNALRQRDGNAWIQRCFSTAGLDVVDMQFDFAHESRDVSKHIRLWMSTTGAFGVFTEILHLWLSDWDVTGGFRADGELYDFVRLLRLTDFNPDAADNPDVCIRFDLSDFDYTYNYLDNVCVDGMTYPTDLFSFSAFTDMGGGDYEVELTTTRPATAEVSCTWSRDAMTLTTDGVAPSSGPARVVFVP